MTDKEKRFVIEPIIICHRLGQSKKPGECSCLEYKSFKPCPRHPKAKKGFITRAEAVERIAKAMVGKNNATPMYIYRELAATALDALLGIVNDK